ncbi:NACHT, LRR and PYD domains-containing protein 12-like [Megalops cyprinoides]|uniref:NACHT, LRR and PYD domains-containing protein 12-like n=1 Tax=Megalops cyprinoides TaxID=118141 RepID=UPI00186543CE|nr:NACHT, LRR and PYD domains-containing protein 12-like [Megalops cyprinoides]
MNESIMRVQQKLKNDMKKKFECISEDLANRGHPALLNEMDTELYITEGGSGGLASQRQTTQETAVLCKDIFKPLPGQSKAIRTVLTNGISGIGKTVSVQKFILNWAEGKANQDISFIFPLPIRNLNLKKGRKFSLMQLLQHYFPELKEIQSVERDEVKVLFIFDGLDECRLPLDFQNSEILGDVTKSTSVDVLLVNLIKGNLLPSALLWVTSQPAAASQIPPVSVHRVTELRGFNDSQKEEYFRKRISDQNLASSIISHMKSSRSLYVMCHIPVFCWISATVLEKLMGGADNGEIPKTVTGMYTHFLLILTNVKNLKYHDTNESNPKEMSISDSEIILKLARMAFLQLEKGNLIFYKTDLRECGIDVSKASAYSGVCTEIFKEESGLHQEKVYCFVHLSIQEYLAALFVFHSCVNEKRNVLRSVKSKPQVDQALQSKNGHLDLFLRFLLGLSLDSNQSLLQGLLTQTGSRSQSIEETVKHIKEKIREESSVERSINLFHCLTELNDNSLVEKIQISLKSGKLSDKKMEPRQCSALAFVLLMSQEVLDVFDLKTYKTSAAGHRRLLPVVKNCRKAILDSCNLTETSCDTVASALQSVPSHLIELDLSYNELGDSGVKRLCAGLKSPNCKLQRLRLDSCNLTERSCDTVPSALQSVPSHLIELDLSYNKLGDSGVKQLCAGLKSANCKLQRLRLDSCNLTETSCDTVAAALQSVPSHLIELDLSYNKLGDSGVKRLCAGLKSPNCKLQRLRLDSCNLTETSCDTVASALLSVPSHLIELDLSYNKLGDSGVKRLCAGLKSPNCKLQRLRLDCCNLTETSCDTVASALQSVPSHLIELDLSYNKLGDSGVERLCAGLKSPNCKLQRLRLDSCNLTDTSCVTVASALQSVPSHLIELDLSYNKLGDSGVERLCAGLKSPNCKLQRLSFRESNLTDGCCDDLASVLRSSHSELRDLELRDNDLQDAGVRALSAGLEDPHCKLQRLGLSGCRITETGCACVASALRSNPSHLRELDLSYNLPGDSGVRALSAGLEDPSCKLETLLVDHGGENRNKPGLRKYACQLTLDPNTAHRYLSLSEGDRKVTNTQQQPYPDHPDRFDCWPQLLCREGLCGTRCYWEAECSGRGEVFIAVTYKGISRKGRGDDCVFGRNINSWSLRYSDGRYSFWHNNNVTDIPPPPSPSRRVGVYLDWPAGTLSFYSVSSDTLTLLHRVHSTFTQPLYPGFGVYNPLFSFSSFYTSVSLCQLE